MVKQYHVIHVIYIYYQSSYQTWYLFHIIDSILIQTNFLDSNKKRLILYLTGVLTFTDRQNLLIFRYHSPVLAMPCTPLKPPHQISCPLSSFVCTARQAESHMHHSVNTHDNLRYPFSNAVHRMYNLHSFLHINTHLLHN